MYMGKDPGRAHRIGGRIRREKSKNSCAVPKTLVSRTRDLNAIRIFFFFNLFYGSIVDLQYCVNFCCTAK